MGYIEVNQLSYTYEHKKILSNISFRVNKRESLGIIGPNGSGKTTLLRSITGLLSGIGGSVYFQNKPIASYKKKELAKLFAVLEQEGTPPVSFTVEEVVAMGRYPWLKPFAQLSKKDYEIINEILLSLEIWDKKDQSVNTLSGGERQLVSLARAMVQEPKVLFLDEPTTFLDISHQRLIMQHVRKWQQEKGLTVVMVLHDLNLAAQYCDRILLMDHGDIKAIGTVSEVLQEEQIESVYKIKPIMIKHPLNMVPQILLD